DIARPDREDFAHAGARTRRDLRHTARRIRHNSQLDGAASHWKGCENNKTRSGCYGFVVISGCGGLIAPRLVLEFPGSSSSQTSSRSASIPAAPMRRNQNYGTYGPRLTTMENGSKQFICRSRRFAHLSI